MQKTLFTLSGILANVDVLLVGLSLLVFGALVNYFAGVRDRLVILGASAPVGVGALVVTAQLTGSLGLGLPLPVTMALALAAAAAAGLLQRVIRKSRPGENGSPIAQASAPIWLAAAVGAGLGIAAWLPSISRTGGPAQNIDDLWHGFLTARIGDMDVVTAATMSPVMVDRADPTTFYPYGLHLAAAAVRAVTGVSVPVALNSMWAAPVGLLLPFATAAFLRLLLPTRPRAACYGAVIVSALQFFPYVLAGIQPYAVALALIPGTLALLLLTVRADRPPGTAVPLVMGVIGVLATHPAAFVALVVFGLLAVGEVVGFLGRRALVPAGLRLVGPAVGAVVLALPLFLSERGNRIPVSYTVSASVESTAKAVKQLLLLQTAWTPKASLLSVLVICGVVGCIARRFHGWSLVVGYLLFSALYVGVLRGQSWPASLVTPWYGEWWRLFGVVVLVAAGLAGMGADTLHAVAAAAVRRARRLGGRRLGAVTGAAAGLLALAIGLVVLRSVLSAQSTVAGTWSPKRVTAADMALYAQLKTRLPKGGTVLNNWYDGSGAMYAIAGARPLSSYGFSQDAGLTSVLRNIARLTPADCRWLIDHRASHALAKPVLLDGAANPMAASLAANTLVFAPAVTDPAGTVYAVKREGLERCAGTA